MARLKSGCRGRRGAPRSSWAFRQELVPVRSVHSGATGEGAPPPGHAPLTSPAAKPASGNARALAAVIQSFPKSGGGRPPRRRPLLARTFPPWRRVPPDYSSLRRRSPRSTRTFPDSQHQAARHPLGVAARHALPSTPVPHRHPIPPALVRGRPAGPKGSQQVDSFEREW
jgi:hypothetical protein